MIAKFMAGVAVSALVATFALAQGPAPNADLPGVNAGAPAPPARGADANLRRSLPTQAQWDVSEGVKRYVAKAKEIAGGDPRWAVSRHSEDGGRSELGGRPRREILEPGERSPIDRLVQNREVPPDQADIQ